MIFSSTRIHFSCFFLQALVSGLLPDSLGNPLVNIIPRDVYSPRITNPAEDTVWTVGSNATITWDTSNPPKNVTNSTGEIVLGHLNGTDSNEHLDLQNPLAEGFDLHSGSVTVTVPEVEPGEDYFVVLIGDSGNRSPLFTVQDLQDVDGFSRDVLQLSSRIGRRFSGLQNF